MTVGTPSTNTLNAARGHPGLRYTCLQSAVTRGGETPDFPTKPCPAGIMAIHHFPACWDGQNLDSPDHQAHMYTTTKEASPRQARVPAPTRSACRKSHTKRCGTPPCSRICGRRMALSRCLVSMDSKGYGIHADYLFGWKGDSLQRAMNDSCMFHKCGSPGVQGVLKTQTVAEMNRCAVQKSVAEDVDGWLAELPGQKMAMKFKA